MPFVGLSPKTLKQFLHDGLYRLRCRKWEEGDTGPLADAVLHLVSVALLVMLRSKPGGRASTALLGSTPAHLVNG